jgi:heat shock protein HslJ
MIQGDNNAMKKWLFLTWLAALAALSLAGACPAAAGADAPLMGTYWKAVAIDGTPVAAQAKPREAHLVFKAQGHRVSGSTGCNRVMGTFTQSADSLRFSKMATTKMACPGSLDIQERDFLSALNASATAAIAGNTLELQDAAGKVRLRFEACTP